jgi:putative PIN family toxin of toxin-antitoxin system
MITAVFDCMVFLQAAASDRSAAFACLEFVESGRVSLQLSPPILAEVRAVLSRPRIRERFPSLTDARVELFVQKLATMAVVVAEVPECGVPLRDPKDLPYLDLAVATNADYLVSRDNDLLDLESDREFVERHPHLRVVEPAAFLHVVRATPSP